MELSRHSTAYLPLLGLPDDCNIETIVATPTLVQATITTLKLVCACRPDGLPARLLKKLKGSLSEPLSLLFTSFMSLKQSS